MKIVGITYREYDDDYSRVSYLNIIKRVLENGCVPLIVNDVTDLSLCDGFILAGGCLFESIIDKRIIDYAKEKDIPLFGLCLGMQFMAHDGDNQTGLIGDESHNVPNVDQVHKVNLMTNSKIHQIVETDELIVNSRHMYKVEDPYLEIAGYSPDGIIEAIEDSSKRFYIGVEWHPEDLVDEDHNKLWKYFFDEIKK